MTIGKLLGAGLAGLVLLTGTPALAEAGHRHDDRCDHSRSHYRSRSHHGRSSYRDSYRYDRRVDYDAPYVARHGSGRDYYRVPNHYYHAPRGYYSAPRGYYAPRPYRRAYHYHGRSRCYRPHSGIGIHLHIGR